MPVLTVIYPSPRSTRCWPLGVRECGVPVTRRWRWRQGGRQGGRAAGRAAGCSAAGEGLLRCERWAALCGALQPPQAEDLLHPRPRLAHQLLVDARRRTQRVRAHLVPSTSHDIHGNSWPAAASCAPVAGSGWIGDRLSPASLEIPGRGGSRTAGRDAKPVGRYAVPELLDTPVCASLPEMPRPGTQYSPNGAGSAAMGW